MSRGILDYNDFPEWLQDNNVTMNIMKSRCKLLYAYHKKVQELGMPMLPVQLYKHSQHIKYNQGKPGLDKKKYRGFSTC